MIKRIARFLAPGPLRRWFQKRQLRNQLAAYPRRVVEHRYGDETLRVELADGLAAGWYDHDWEPLPELAVLARHRLRPGARVFDVGAHQGDVGLMLGRRVGASGQVIVVEPNPHNFAMCGRNVALNAMPWVIPHHAAVAEVEGTIRFNGGLNGAAAAISDYGGVTDVPAVTLDALTALSARCEVCSEEPNSVEAVVRMAPALSLTLVSSFSTCGRNEAMAVSMVARRCS